MKKVFAILMTVVLLLSFAAFAEADNSLQAIQEKGYLILGLDDSFPPMGFNDENGNIVGFDIDLAREVCKRLGVELQTQPIDWAAKEALLDAGNIDCIWNGMSITPARQLEVNFSSPYINAGVAVIVKADSGYTTTDDLKGKLIGVQLGTTSDFEAEKITGLDNVAQYNTFLNAIMDLQGNKIDAVIIDKPVGQAILASLKDDTLQMVDMGLQADWYGIEVNKENPELLKKINDALAELEKEGFFDELAVKYFN